MTAETGRRWKPYVARGAPKTVVAPAVSESLHRPSPRPLTLLSPFQKRQHPVGDGEHRCDRAPHVHPPGIVRGYAAERRAWLAPSPGRPPPPGFHFVKRHVPQSEWRGLWSTTLPVLSQKTSTLVVRQAMTAKIVPRKAQRWNVALKNSFWSSNQVLP